MISELRVMRGPNYWSANHHKLIIIKLNIPTIEDLNIIALKEKISITIPSIKSNLNNDPFKCPTGLSPSLIITLLTAMICKELQILADVDVDFYDAHGSDNSYYACFEYHEEEVGKLVANCTAKIVDSFLSNSPYTDLQKDILKIKELSTELFLGANTNEIIRTAILQKIPVQKIKDEKCTLFGHGYKQKKIHNAVLKNISDFPIIQHMFPDNDSGRIPVVAVTGTNGKTTTTRLIAHIAKENRLNVGFTSSDGIYRNETLIEKGDCSGPESAQVVLSDPCVSFAVLECARGGIIRAGLGIDQCDIGIVTNIAADHLGLKDINTLEDLANVKGVVLQAVKETGFAILNADDDLVYEMSKGLKCRVGYFSLYPENERIVKHCRKGGLAITKDDAGNLIIIEGIKITEIENVKNIPLTMGGHASFMIENVMPAVLASYILNFSLNAIRTAIKSFTPSVKHTPGRLNLFKVNDVNILFDYAHNPHGFKAIGNFMKNISAHKTGIITAVGDRRDEDISEIGKLAAAMYDRIIIRLDDNLRGKTEKEIIGLIESGIKKTNPEFPYTVIHDTRDALKYALGSSSPGSYIVFSAENVMNGINMISEFQDEYNI